MAVAAPGVIIKNAYQIRHIRTACEMLKQVHDHLRTIIRPGVSTGELDAIAERMIRKMGGIPAFKGYRGGRGVPDFPATLCTSINEEIVHGIPSNDRILKEGDILSVDGGVIWKGFYSDAAFTVPIGEVSETAKRLIECTRRTCLEAIEFARPGCTTGDVGHRCQEIAESYGFAPVRHLYGHGVGIRLHEPPAIMNYGEAGSGVEFVPGMVVAIEMMICEHGYELDTLGDGWTIATADRGLSAHVEETVLITKQGPEILTHINTEGFVPGYSAYLSA
ncbi:MAG: Methionine aminopeptidase 1 [bacterium]|nr:Methionine aminopeptidase 1 [bacterium]